MRKTIQRCRYLIVASAGLCLLGAAPAALPKPANFLFVAVADVGWSDWPVSIRKQMPGIAIKLSSARGTFKQDKETDA